MKKNLYILTSMFIFAAAVIGCSKDDDDAVTPSPTPATESGVVDLGLPSGTLWAKANLGAETEYEKGNLYAWGETYTKEYYNASNYFDPSNTIVTSNITGTDYDAAKTALGGDWVMPTTAQFKELFSLCKVSRKTLNDQKVLEFVGPNEQVLYLPEIGISSDATLYDQYTDEKDKVNYAKFENVYTAYWTGEIANSDPTNANQYAVQFLYVEHAKDAVKKGGATQYGDYYYNRSRLVGAPIRPVKANGGTPIEQYVDIKGKWAQSDAEGTPIALSQAPQFISFEGSNFTGKGVNVVYGSTYSEVTYSRNVNTLIITFNGESKEMTVADVTTIPATDSEAAKRVISLSADGEVIYFVETEETPAVPVATLAGKWDFNYNGSAYVLNILDDANCVVTKGEQKVNATFEYRFGCFIIDCEVLSGVFAVEPTVGGECPFQFAVEGNAIAFTVHPKEYETIYAWSGLTATELPTWMSLSDGNKNSLATGSDIKAVFDADGNQYTSAIKFNASWPSTSNPFDATVVEVTISGGFKTGDRIRVKGYTNADGKTGGLKIWAAEDNQLGTTAPAINDFKAGEDTMDKESVFTFTSDAAKIYVCREAGTGTFITDFLIDREKEE